MILHCKYLRYLHKTNTSVYAIQGLEKSVLQIKWTDSWILRFFQEKMNKTDKTEFYIFIAGNAELGNFFKKEKKVKMELGPSKRN